MFTNNPFAGLSASIPPAVMQTYVVIMIVLVAAGTLFDIVHKGSARYFFDNWRKSKSKGSQASRWRRIGVARHPRPALSTFWRPGNSATRAAASPIC